MGIDKQQPAIVEAQTFPNAVAKHETGIENRHHSVGAADETATQPDQQVIVARIGGKVL